MTPDLELQKAIRARLIATPAVLALVSAASIQDVNQHPAAMPSIVLGQSQMIDEGTSLRRAHVRVYHTIHVWQREPSLEGVKQICGAIRAAMQPWRPALPAGLHCADLRVSQIRTFRDPDGEHSHGVVTIDALLVEVVS